MRKHQIAFLALALTVLAGCGYFGMPKPETTTERLAYAHSTVNSVVAATTNALNANAIGVSDAEYVSKTAKETRMLLDAVELALSAGDIATAEGRLVLAQNVLSELQRYLAARGVR